MKLYTIILLSIIPMFLTAQTTVEEYEYLTVTYPIQMTKSEIPEKTGYYFQDLMNMVDNSGKVRLLYKEAQTSVVPIATVIHVNGGDKTFYICVPHEDSENFVFDKYADDLQRLFEESEVARNNYSKIMFRYPKQLQKYYDEISALENGTTASNKPPLSNGLKADLTPPPAEVTPELTNKPKPIVVETPKENTETAKSPSTAEATPKVQIKLIDKPSTPTKSEQPVVKKGKSSAKVYSVLTQRTVLKQPEVINETDKYGVVRIDVCVNAKGEIITATYNSNDSDTKDKELVEIAEGLAKQYVFEKSHLSRQCGYVIFKFQFQ